MFKNITPAEFKENPFALEDTWALVGASFEGASNALTVSWGFFGPIWQKKAAVLVNVRPHRFTHSLLQKAETFSVNIFDDSFKKMLGYMGSASGSKEDKIAKSGLSMSLVEGAPVFEQARLVLVCKTMYKDSYKETGFLDAGIPQRVYPQQDYHTFFIGEVLQILTK